MQPPENPYEGFPNPNEPLPSSPPPYLQGVPEGVPQGVPPRAPEINFDVISQAWTVLQSSIGTYIGATFVAGIPFAISYMIYINAIFRAPKDALGQPDVTQIGAGVFVFFLIGSALYGLLLAGVMRMAINHLKTGRADFGQVLSAYDVFPSLILAGILITIATYLGMCLCIVPGLLLSGLYMFVWPLILDRRMGAIQAMRTSFNALKPHMWMALLFIIVLSLIAQVGLMFCFVGGLVSVPLAILSVAITYRNFFPDGEGGFNFATKTGPVAPIADPHR